jgi:hypothetical protein
MRKRYPVIVLLIVLVAIALSASLVTTNADALPGFALLLLVDLAAVWVAVAGSWSVFVVVVVCVVDGLADGIFAWLRCRASWAAGAADDPRDRVLVREFLRTYLVVTGAMAMVAYMVFTGVLLRPGGKAPLDPGAAFTTWQFWAVAVGLVAMRGFLFLWDFVLGGEARVVPPAAVVSEPLRRLFVLQFGVLVGGLLVYWPFDSTVAGLAVILVAKTAIDLALALLERLRVARIKAAVAAGVTAEPRPAEKRPRPLAAGASAASAELSSDRGGCQRAGPRHVAVRGAPFSDLPGRQGGRLTFGRSARRGMLPRRSAVVYD